MTTASSLKLSSLLRHSEFARARNAWTVREVDPYESGHMRLETLKGKIDEKRYQAIRRASHRKQACGGAFP